MDAHIEGSSNFGMQPGRRKETLEDALLLAGKLAALQKEDTPASLAEARETIALLKAILGVENEIAPIRVQMVGEKPFLAPHTPVRIAYRNDCSDTEALERAVPMLERRFPVGTPIDSLQIKPFAKAEIGFNLASRICQAAHDSHKDPLPTIYIANAAPRVAGAKDCEGCPFVFARLPENHFYFGTMGEELAIVAPWIKEGELWLLDVAVKGTPYRSRFLAEAARRWHAGDESVLVKPVAVGQIPSLDPFSVGVTDSQGNIKTNLDSKHTFFEGHAYGDLLYVTINGVTNEVRYAKTLAEGGDGDLVIAIGSTCHDLDNKHNTKYDIYKIRGSAERAFASPLGLAQLNGCPNSGDTIEMVWKESSKR